MHLVNLEELELDEVPNKLPRRFTSPFPNLRKLSLWQDLDLDEAEFQFNVWKDVSRLKKLEDVTLRIAEGHGDLAKLPNLLSKIRTFFITCYDSFLELVKVPQFQPTTLVGLGEEWPDDFEEDHMPAAQTWRGIVGMTSLRNFSAQYMQADLLHRMGFPPNLQSIYLDHMYQLDLAGVEAIPEIRAKIPPSLTKITIDMFITDIPHKETDEWNDIREEIIFWDSLNSPDYRISLDFGLDDDEEAQRIYDLEEEANQHKRAMNAANV